MLAGVAVMVDGVFDHRLFVQTFGSSKALRDAGVTQGQIDQMMVDNPRSFFSPDARQGVLNRTMERERAR
jgi:hypothetical protein